MKRKQSSFYRTEPFSRDNLGYYIHWRDENLGRLQRGKKGDITHYFVDQKDRFKKQAGKALKKQYKYLIHSMIDQKDAQSLAFASRLVGRGRVGDDLITALDTYVKQTLVKRINEETIKASLITGNQFHNHLNNRKLDNTLSSNLTSAGNALNKLLEGVAQVINTLKVNENYKNFSLGLTAAEIEGLTSIGDLGKLFGSKVDEIKKLSRSRSFYIDKNQIEVLTRTLNNITRWLQSQEINGKVKDGNSFTYKNLKSLFDTEISPIGIGEAFGFYNKRMAQEALQQTIVDSIKYIGKEEYPIIFSDPSGQYSKSSPMPDTNMDDEKQGKTDIKFKNLEVKLRTQKRSKKELTLSISVGVSNKLYLNNAIIKNVDGEQQIKKQLTRSVKVSKNIPMGAAIKSTFHQERLIYLAYNTFAWQTESPEASEAVKSLQDIVFTRNLIHAMSARSGEDFAGYILMNGKLFSVWDIIQYALSNNIGALTEDQKAGTGTKGIKYSWDEDKGVEQARNNIVHYVQDRNRISMEQRIIGANEGINKTKLYVHLNPNYLTF